MTDLLWSIGCRSGLVHGAHLGVRVDSAGVILSEQEVRSVIGEYTLYSFTTGRDQGQIGLRGSGDSNNKAAEQR